MKLPRIRRDSGAGVPSALSSACRARRRRRHRPAGCRRRSTRDGPVRRSRRPRRGPCRHRSARRWRGALAVVRMSGVTSELLVDRSGCPCARCRTAPRRTSAASRVATQRAHGLEIITLQRMDAALALHRLEDHRGDVPGCPRRCAAAHPGRPRDAQEAAARAARSRPGSCGCRWRTGWPGCGHERRPPARRSAGRSMPRWWACSRASLIAASLASAPELLKNTRCMPARCGQSARRAASCASMRYRLEVCTSAAACADRGCRDTRVGVAEVGDGDAGYGRRGTRGPRHRKYGAAAVAEAHGQRA
jgi:hypothetical protein